MPGSAQGFEAWIEVEGRKLDEFKVKTEGDKIVCWVPCDAGKEFRIGCTVPADQLRLAHISVSVDLDGIGADINNNLYQKKQGALNSESRYFAEELVENDTASRAFQFGSLELTDDDSYLHPTTKRFGEISVGLYSVQGFRQTTIQGVQHEKEDIYRIHEKAKKAIAHCVKFGEEKPLATGKTPLKVEAIGQKKLCAFIFNYRHMDILVADGIVQRKVTEPVHRNAIASSSQSVAQGATRQSSAKRKLSEVKEERITEDLLDPTDKDIQSLESQLAALKARKARATASGSQAPVKRVKREHQSTLVPGEIIDLTNLPTRPRSHVKREPNTTLAPGEVIDLT